MTKTIVVTDPVREDFELDALTRLFRGLSNAGVRHAVLRNFEQLPRSLGARDIDIVVHPKDLAKAVSVVAEVAQGLGLVFANHYRDERLVQFALLRRVGPGRIFDLKIDFFTSSQVYGIEVLSAQEMLRNLRWHNGIPVVSEVVQLLDKWLFHLVVGKPLHPKYDAQFGKIAREAHLPLLDVLIPLMGSDNAENLVKGLAEGCGSRIASLGPSSRFRMLVRMWHRQAGLGRLLVVRFLFERILNRLSPHGLFLSISGPDGSGKTTVTDLVLAQLRQIYGPDAVEYHHFRPAALPRIAELAKAAKAVERVDVDYSRPHRADPSRLAGSLARLSYYGLDYVYGYFRAIRPSLVDRKVVLFDRYYYDMVCDPGRSRIRLPTGVLRRVARLLPLPDFAFFIRATPEVVHRRKQELTLEQIRVLNARYDDLANRDVLVAINNDGAPEQAADAIIDHVVARRDQVARQTLGLVRR